jgi:hypothetical protein
MKSSAFPNCLLEIFESGELDEKSVISILETTAGDGKPLEMLLLSDKQEGF